MGSHGGATAKGQAAVLERLGVTEAACGAPVVSSMEVERIGTVFGEVPLYFARDALALEHSIVVNRIKPHTKFIGPAESGILKMLCIGMGKHLGAVAYHTWAMKYGFFQLLKEMGGRSPPTAISASAWPWWRIPSTRRSASVPSPPAGFSKTRPASTYWPRPTSRGCRSGSWMSWWWSGSERRSAAPAWTQT
jgi:hypothetical protein